MSLLAPLYFLGALAIGLPIVFHLIRRQPKGEVRFSSLMFLRPTPPRLTRRSRLENWPLLLVRALILALLAAAFARPLLRTAELIDQPVARTATVLLIDTSASMRRNGLWQQALDQVDQLIEQRQIGDQLAVVGFDRVPRTLFSFEQSSQIAPQQLQAAARAALEGLSPTWHRTDLGGALRHAAEIAASRDHRDVRPLATIELISDMPRSGQIEKLQSYAWPDDVVLQVRPVIANTSTNAVATVIGESEADAGAEPQVRVRVFNSANAAVAGFEVGWDRSDRESDLLPVQVPPGQSRVVKLPLPDGQVQSLLLRGDDDSFDNQSYYVVPESRQMTLLSIGPATDQPRDSLDHYLKQAPLGGRYRTVVVESRTAQQVDVIGNVEQVPLVVVHQPLTNELVESLQRYVNDGGRLLFVLADADGAAATVAACNAITNSRLTVGEAQVDDYAMLSRIDFGHPLFAPLAEPPYNDFSQIRFWSHRSLGGISDNWRTVASFDDGSPALVEQSIGQGVAWVLTCGWQPAASQLALSTKFVPLLIQLLQSNQELGDVTELTVGDPVPLTPSPTATITGPGDIDIPFRKPIDAAEIDRPGIYRFSDGQRETRFAVNLDLMESRTETVSPDTLEQFGVVLKPDNSPQQQADQRRQLRDRELEGRQRIWQWLLAAALGLMGLETWMGKRAHVSGNQ